MPFKFHEPHRHRVPQARYRVRNWAQYDRGSVARGDIRLWLSAEAIAHWKAACRKTPGGQRTFSNLAIETALTLGSMYGLPLRQCEGFVRSLIELMHLDLTAPDHTTLARRRRHVKVSDFRWPRTRPVDIVIDSTGLKFYGAGEWARAKHGESRRSWRKLHISVNPVDHEIIAFELTDDDTSDASMAGALVSDRVVTSAPSSPTAPMMASRHMTRSGPRDHQSYRRGSSFRHRHGQSLTRARFMAAASGSAMPPRSPGMAEWPGRGGMATGDDH
ncbi:IS5 family transposase [Mesorhizobium camelthorni]|uniref:IS5 family transposase n=1 Tax=Allomesorhizobium camelthorni TaxID=475069 RepID=A0A6G4WNJ5_9HYPH|nr:IS5 family transposase [Mesorhizobium camelthorni]NGO56214.1 IS5 family transposase [Mesorhizobium camelthorni]